MSTRGSATSWPLFIFGGDMGWMDSKYIYNAGAGRLMHWCPGCDGPHMIWTEGSNELTGSKWGYNGNPECPTFSPSIKISYERWVPPYIFGQPDPGPQRKIVEICHYFLKDGRLEYCPDSTHSLAGQTVDLPVYPSEEERLDRLSDD